MKIVKIYEPGQRKSITVKGQTQKVYEKLGYYVMLLKARCGNHRVEIHEKTNPRIFRMIRDGKLNAGNDLISLIEQHMPREI